MLLFLVTALLLQPWRLASPFVIMVLVLSRIFANFANFVVVIFDASAMALLLLLLVVVVL